MRRFAIALLLSAPVLSGCAEMTHLTRQRQMADSSVAFIDAKQRAIFANANFFCAEPSPDALSALAASNSIDLSTPEGTSVGQSFSIAEAAGAIGLRTQSIQLMRDHMYRLCEGYMSGSISPTNFQLMHRRMQATVVGILAIEQLTGVVRQPSVVLSGDADAGSGNAEGIAALTNLRESQRADIASTKSSIEKLEGEAATIAGNLKAKRDAAAKDTSNATLQEEVKTLEKSETDKKVKIASEKEKLADLQEAYDATGDLLKRAQTVTSASSQGKIESVKLESGDIAALANAVDSIVERTFNLTQNDVKDLCTIVVSDSYSNYQFSPDSRPKTIAGLSDLQNFCLNIFINQKELFK